MSSQEIQQVIPDALLFSKSPKLLSFVKERRQIRQYPVGSTTFTEGQTIEFELRSDQLIDCPCASLVFDVSFPTATTQIANACDFIKSCRLFYNDIEVEQVLNANTMANLFLAYGINKTFAESEANVYLGLTNQFVQASNNKSRQYSVPLSLLFGLFRSSQQLLPVLSNRIRMVFELESSARVINFCVNTSDTYTLRNVSLIYDEIIVSDPFRKKLLDAVSSDTGIRLPFTSSQQQQLQVPSATNVFYGRINFNLSNVVSVHMLVDDNVKDTRDASQNILNRQSYPLTNFDKVYVRCGSQNLTPADGTRGYVELFQQQNKTLSCLNDFYGTGLIKYEDLTAGYTRASTIAGGSYGMCPVSIGCDKLVMNDDNVLGSGISSTGANQFDIELYKTSGNNFATTQTIICALVHKRAIVMSNRGVIVEY